MLVIGRRVFAFADIELAGDYFGPTSDDRYPPEESMWFLLPIARDPDVPPGARSLHRISFPPHVYRECPDGSLEVRESIGAYGDGPDRLWHGYLDEGHSWRTV